MKNKKGFTLIELIVCFALVTVLTISLFKTVLNIQQKQLKNISYNSFLSFVSVLNNTIQSDFNKDTIINVVSCGTNCYDITYKDKGLTRLQVDRVNNTITYGSDVEELPKNYKFVKDISFNTYSSVTTGNYDSYYLLRLPIKSDLFPNLEDIKYMYQYNSGTIETNKYILNLDLNGGTLTGEYNNLLYSTGTTVTLPTPTRENYVFKNWIKESDNSALSGNTFTMGTSNTKLIAVWIRYEVDGLILWYDGINNTNSGHNNSSAIWKDLSGNNRDGTLNGGTWGDNYLNFDGVDDWVSIGLLNQNIYTIEIIASQNEIVSGSSYTICNLESGGYGLIFKDGYMNNITYISGYKYCSNSNVSNIDSIEAYSGTYNNVNTKLFKNGILINQSAQTGNIGVPANDTIMVIGGNPTRNNVSSSGYFNGKIYSVRIYDRALTDEEIQNNYDIDKARYELD